MYRGRKTSPRLRPLALAAAIAALNPLAFSPARAQAADSVSSVQDYDIAAGPLDETLVTIARKSGRTILFAPALVAPYKAGPVAGQLSFDEALRRALAGSGLHAEIAAGGSVTIRAGASPVPVSAAATPPAAASGVAAAQRQERVDARPVQENQSVTVLGQRGEQNYLTDSTSGATRTDTPLSEVPNSVSVVTRLLIDDQQANSLDDMMRNVAGVQDMSAGGAPGGAFAVRGFTVENTMTDGMMGEGTLGNAIPLIGVDHVEVLKGPEAIIGGAGARYGGVIDVVMKKPQAQKVRGLELLLSDYGHESIGVDLAGPVMQDDNRLTYRLVGSDERSDRNFLGYEGIRHDYVAASGGWKDADTSLVVGVDRTVNHDPVVPYTVALGTQPSRSVPLRVLGNSSDGFGYQQTRTYYEFEQRLTSQWSLRSRGSDVEQGLNFNFWIPVTVTAAASGDILNRANAGDVRIRSQTMQNDLIGKFSTGALDHTVVVGTDYFHQNTSDLIQIKDVEPFNVFTSSGLPAVTSLSPLVSIPVTIRNGEDGVFLQDQVAIGEKWHFLVALRRATYLGYTDPNTRKWLPNAGVVYSFSPEVSVYTSTNNGYSARAGETESSREAHAVERLAVADDFDLPHRRQ
jgi:iron complex outermembrane recepter protein